MGATIFLVTRWRKCSKRFTDQSLQRLHKEHLSSNMCHQLNNESLSQLNESKVKMKARLKTNSLSDEKREVHNGDIW